MDKSAAVTIAKRTGYNVAIVLLTYGILTATERFFGVAAAWIVGAVLTVVTIYFTVIKQPR